jgi:glutathione synthase/RimK-type ligase-like ATP-grasp enzyme
MRGAPERAYEVARIFESLGGRVSDPVSTLAYAAGKLLPYVARRGNVPYISSYFFNTSTTSLEQVLMAVSYPFILKPQSGFQGKGVALINGAAEYETYVAVSAEPSLMAQNYLADIVDEFRVVVIGGDGIGVVRKDRAVSEDDPFNADHDTDVAVKDAEVQAFAELAARVGGGDVYGADVARTSSGALYLIENNRCPNIVTFREATQVHVEDKLIDFLLR